jgi:hypothetical protein
MRDFRQIKLRGMMVELTFKKKNLNLVIEVMNSSSFGSIDLSKKNQQ